MDLGLVYMDGKLRYRPKTFMRVQDSKQSFLSSNCSNKKKRHNLSCSPDTI